MRDYRKELEERARAYHEKFKHFTIIDSEIEGDEVYITIRDDYSDTWYRFGASCYVEWDYDICSYVIEDVINMVNGEKTSDSLVDQFADAELESIVEGMEPDYEGAFAERMASAYERCCDD